VSGPLSCFLHIAHSNPLKKAKLTIFIHIKITLKNNFAKIFYIDTRLLSTIKSASSILFLTNCCGCFMPVPVSRILLWDLKRFDGIIFNEILGHFEP
jgi:hypothetical protein